MAGLWQLVISLRCPGSGGIVAQGLQEHPAERGTLAHSPDTRRPLKIAGDATHEVNARDRQPRKDARPQKPGELEGIRTFLPITVLS